MSSPKYIKFRHWQAVFALLVVYISGLNFIRPVSAQKFIDCGQEFWVEATNQPLIESSAINIQFDGEFPYYSSGHWSVRWMDDGFQMNWNVPGRQSEWHLRPHALPDGQIPGEKTRHTPHIADRFHIDGNTLQKWNSSGVIEHYSAAAESISITWILTEKPDATEDGYNFWLTSGIPATFLSGDNRTTTLQNKKGGTPLSIGEALIVDSAGMVIPVRAEVNGEAVCWHIPQEVLDSASYPLCLDPQIGPERGVPLISVSSNDNPQFSPQVMGTDDQFFSVWADQIDDGNHRIWGTRIDTSGNVLDPGGFLISENSGDNINPSIARGFDTILVTWEERSNRNDSRILGMVLSIESGRRLLPEPVEIIDLPLNQQMPVAAFTGNHFLVACQSEVRPDNLREFDIVVRRVDATGRIPDPEPSIVTDAPFNQIRPAITATEQAFHLVWEDLQDGKSSQIYGVRIPRGELPESFRPVQVTDTGSAILNPRIIALPGEDTSATIVFQMRGENEKYGIYAIETDLSTNDPATELAIIIQDDEDKTRPVITESSGRLMVAWEENSISTGFLRKNIQATLLNSDLTPANQNLIKITDHEKPQSKPSITTAGAVTLTAWEDFRTGDNLDIFYRIGVAIPGSDEFINISTEQIASNAPSDQDYPAVLLHNNIAHIAWSEKGMESGYDIYMIRQDLETGEVIDANPLTLSDAPGDQTHISLIKAFDSFYGFWQSQPPDEPAEIFGVRIPTDYTLEFEVDPVSLGNVAGNRLEPSVTVGETELFLAFLNTSSRTQQRRIMAHYLTPGLELINDQAIILSTSGNAAKSPETATLGGDFLVTFSEEHSNGFEGPRTGWLPSIYTSERNPVFFDEPEPDNDMILPSLVAHGDSLTLYWIDDLEDEQRVASRTFIRQGPGIYEPSRSQTFVSPRKISKASYISNGIHDNSVTFRPDVNERGQNNLVVSRLNHDGLNTMDFGKFLVTPDVEIRRMASAAEGNKSIVAYTSIIPPDLGKVLFREAVVENSPRLVISGKVEGSVNVTQRLPVTTTAEIIDFDSSHFGSGRMVITLNNTAPPDQLEIFSGDGALTVDSNSIFMEGRIIGLFSGGNPGQSTLELILTPEATPERVATLLQSIHYNYSRVDLDEALTTRTGTIVLTDGKGGVSSPAVYTIDIEAQAGPPKITSITEGRTANPGESVTLSVVAVGAPPFNYQWFKDGTRIQGAQSRSHTINSFSFANSGLYTVEVWNTEGRVRSNPVELELITVDLCVRWRSVPGNIYHVVGKVSDEDATWSSVSPAIQASQTQSEFCLPLTSPFRIFEVRDGDPPPFTIQDPTELVDVSIFIENDEICMTWPAIAGNPYRIESRRPSDTEWKQEGELITFDSFIGRFCITPDNQPKFFRVFGPPLASARPITIPITNFRLTDDRIQFSWAGRSTRFYQVQYTRKLSGGWANFVSTVEETGFDFTFDEPIDDFDGDTVFFRVLQLP